MSLRNPLILLAVAALAGGAFYLARGAEAPEIVRPRDASSLGEGVRALVDEHLAAAEADPHDPERHGLLALVYEANELFVEAQAAYSAAAQLAPDDPMWPYHAAVCRWEAGEPDVALVEIDAVLERFPGYIQARYRRGEWRVERGEYDGAEEDFRVTAEAQPNIPQGHTGLGKVALERGDHQTAAGHLLRALTKDPGYGVAHYLLGSAYRGLGRLEEAAREQALGLGAATVFLGDRMDELERGATAGITVQIDQAIELIQTGRADEAVTILERARAVHAGDTRVLVNLAIAYRGAGRPADQLAALEEAREIAPDEIGTLINLARCYIDLSRLDDSIAASSRALQLDPRSAHAHFARGHAFLIQRRVDEGYDALTLAVRYGPQLDEARAALVEACSILKKNDEARRHLEELLRRRPNDLKTLVNLGETCLLQGDLADAEEAYASAKQLAPEHPRVLKLGSKIEERRGR